MTQLSKFLIGALLSLLLTSCNFDINFGEGERGNGDVQTEDRTVTEAFTVVKASEGLDVYVMQESPASIRVEADENIMGLIRTDIKNGTLRIHTEKSIGRATKKIYVSLPTITKLSASSGSDLIGKSTIKADIIELDASSGADLIVTVNANEVDADASSGSDIRVSGKAERLVADASSGSDIKAAELEVKKCTASASSGADISVNATESLTADANSGADIRYRGNPENVSKNKSMSGSVSKQ